MHRNDCFVLLKPLLGWCPVWAVTVLGFSSFGSRCNAVHAGVVRIYWPVSLVYIYTHVSIPGYITYVNRGQAQRCV